MFLCDAYEEEKVADKGNDDDFRTVLHIHPKIAPITVAVLPLMKKDGLAEMAKIQNELKEDFMTDYDQSVAIGKRYRRQDEVGTPFCVTVDYDSKNDNTVTLRSAILWIRFEFPKRTCRPYSSGNKKLYIRKDKGCQIIIDSLSFWRLTWNM